VLSPRATTLFPHARSLALPAALAVAGLVSLSSGRAEAQLLRYASTSPGGIVATGNTLGLSKASSLNSPGVADSIGTFISLDQASVDDLPTSTGEPWPNGTTYDWTKNGSEAVLTLPAGSEVLYAELVWGGSYAYGTEDVTASLDDAVTLHAAGQTTQASPDALTALTVNESSGAGFEIRYYLRSANVTSFVKQFGSNTYAVSGVPATQDAAINTLNAGGWTLLVAYRGELSPIRNLSVFVGGSFVDEDTTVDYSVSGFCAPPTGNVEGTVVVSALEGDANRTGDVLLIAETAADQFVNLSGPNNPETNFFCSQINGSDGEVDTQGSFGTANQDALAGTNVVGGRQGWDVTTLPLSSADGHLSNAQTAAVVRTITTGDSYLPVAVAMALDVNAPVFGQGSDFTSDVTSVREGDEITLTATLSNTGQAVAEGLTLQLPLQPNIELVEYTTDGVQGDSTGAQVTAAMLGAGALAGDLEGNGADRQVVMKLRVNGPPSNGTHFPFSATWGYEYRVCAGDPPASESVAMVTLFVTWESDQDAGTGGAGGSAGAAGASGQGGSGGSAGDGGAAGGGGSAGDGGAAGTAGTAGTAGSAGAAGQTYEPEWQDSGSDGGCGCAIPGKDRKSTWAALLAGLAAVGVTMLRRRRAAR